MTWSFVFFFNSFMLGLGLTMDAFSVSIANGLNEPKMKVGKMCGVAGTYGIFQFAMPMIGWICVHTIYEKFSEFKYAIPWIALGLLLFIGGKMIVEGFTSKVSEEEEESKKKLTFGLLMVQGIATAIDALSVGFTIAEYSWEFAVVASLIIGLITFIACMIALKIGKIVGDKLSDKATIVGGVILVGIGFEIFITNTLDLAYLPTWGTWVLALGILLVSVLVFFLLIKLEKKKSAKQI